MYVGAALVPDAQASILMHPGMGSFHHPTVEAQAAPVLGVAFRQDGFDMSGEEFLAVRFGVVAAVSQHGVRPVPRSARPPAESGDRVHEGQELRDIVGVGPRQDRGQREALTVSDHMVLAARLGAIRGIRAGFRPPKTARTDELSTTARDQSIWSAPLSFASR